MSKGQISIFIIIGIIILLSGGLIFYIMNASTQGQGEIDIKESVLAQYKGQTQSRDLILTCLSQIVHEGISIMRMQGGFIDIPSHYKYLAVPGNYEIYNVNGSKRIRRNNNSIIFVPYYVTAELGFMAPTLDDLEAELEGYIDRELKLCVDGLAPIRDYVKIDINEGSVTSDVEMGTSITVKGEYEVEGAVGSVEWEIEDFAYEIPVNMRKMHQYARNLAMVEIYDTYLEHHIKQIISLYSYGGGAKENDDLPPFSFSTTNIDGQQVTWSEDEAAAQLKFLISETMPLLKINATRFERMTSDDPLEQGVYDSFIRNYFPRDDLASIYFVYDVSWGGDISIGPKSGSLLKPSLFQKTNFPIISNLNTLTYRFKYDVTLPILTMIHDYWSVWVDPQNENVIGNGMTFYFVMEPYLCGNNERSCVPPVDYSSFYNASDVPADNYSIEDIGYCEYKQSPAQTIQVKDRYSGELLDDVSVHYKCANEFNDCKIATTGSNGMISASFPYCQNGLIYFKKDGYKPEEFILSVIPNESAYNYTLEPTTQLTLKMKGIKVREFATHYMMTDAFTTYQPCNGADPDTLWDSTLFDVNEDDYVSVELVGKNRNLIKESLVYPFTDTMELASGNYTVRINYIGNMTIHPSTFDNFTIGFAGEAPDYETYEGMWDLGSSEYEISIPPSVRSKDTITLYLLAETPSNSETEVRYFDVPALRQGGNITYDAYLDYNCNGTQEYITYNVFKDHYKHLIQPILE